MSTVFGLDEDAWKMWIEYRKQIKKSLKSASIPLAQKRLAALGPQQREAVEYSIANGYQGLFAPKSAKQVVKRMTDDVKKLESLAERARAVGFREPRDGEDSITYEMLVRRAEDDAYWKRRGKARSVADLLGAKP